ncbi:MAG TPA: glycosyltransferase [Streptosporangiaceae bacterium]
MTSPPAPPLRLLLLVADTGGGHRSAACAVSQALAARHPGRFAPVLVDPLGGPAVPFRLRWPVGLYGPCVRLAPWLWGILWRFAGSPRNLAFLRRTLFSPATDGVADAVAAWRPAAIVAFHAMTARPAVRARDRITPGIPVITVVTDLIRMHLAWRDGGTDLTLVPSTAAAERFMLDGLGPDRCVEIGLPVPASFTGTPPPLRQRAAIRQALGLTGRFVVVVAGGAEGSGGIFRRAASLVRRLDGVDVVAICGRNRRVQRKLARLAARAGGRLTVHGMVDNMADWLRCADLVVTKAGPGMIAEAACCGVPLVLTSHLPGQEEGNTEFVVAAGAGVHVPKTRQLAAAVARLRADPAALAAMGAAAAALGRPGAAADIADLLAGLVDETGHGHAPGKGDVPAVLSG